ncbi:MAG: ribosome silencing factor [Microcystaceae cyanobacterium]
MSDSQNAVDASPTLTQAIPPLLQTIFQAADDRKGGDINILQVTEVSYLADYFVIVTGFSRTQVKAIADAILDTVKIQYDKSPLRIEGVGENSWIVMDYGDVIIHIFLPQEREFYNLEAFWGHAQPIDVSLLNSVQ